MADVKRRGRVKPRSKVVAKKAAQVDKPGEKVLLFQVVDLEKEGAGLLAIRSDDLMSFNKDITYRIVPSRGSVSVSFKGESDQRRLEQTVEGPTQSDDPIRKVTERLGIAMRAAHADLESVDIGNLVRSMMRVVPNKSNELADQVGPFYDTAGLTTWLDKSRQAIDKQVQSGKLLACMTSDRVRLYPVWQFTESGDLLPGLRDVLAALHAGTHDGWTQAVWLLTPTEELDGSALKWLKARHDPAPVVELAREDAAVWAA